MELMVPSPTHVLGPLAYRVMIECKLAQGPVIAHSDAPREEMQAVFDWLTNPLVRRALWTDDTRTSIVVA